MKTTNDNAPLTQSTDELEFAYRVRHALDERIAVMPKNITDRLSAAHKIAMARKKPDSIDYAIAPRLAGINDSHNSWNGSLNWLKRISLIIPLFALILGSVGIYYYEQERRIDDLAELDTAVLADELPVTAYLDHGFEVYLSKHGE